MFREGCFATGRRSKKPVAKRDRGFHAYGLAVTGISCWVGRLMLATWYSMATILAFGRHIPQSLLAACRNIPNRGLHVESGRYSVEAVHERTSLEFQQTLVLVSCLG